MSKKADITFYQGKGGTFVAHPNPFVLRKGVSQFRIRNLSDAEIQVHLKDAPVEGEELWINPRATETVRVKPSVAEGLYELQASSAAPSRRQGDLEASPKIIVEASPKIIVEGAARIIVEG